MKIKEIPILLPVLVIVFLSFIPVLSNGFINYWDDHLLLVRNPHVHELSLDSLKEMFSKTYVDTYIPLTLLSFAVEYQFAGENPFIYHLDNLILHIAVVALIFIFAKQIGLSQRAAAVAVLLFGIHPMHVESVAWITERKDVLYAFFYMLALISYGGYLKNHRGRSFVLSIAFTLLSILAKPMAYSLPLMLLALDWLFGRKFNARVFVEKIPHFLCVFLLSLITYLEFSQGRLTLDSVLIWIWSFSFHIQKFIWPVQLSPHYELLYPISIFNANYIIAVGVFYSLCLLLNIYRRNRVVMFSFIFYFVSIFALLRYHDVSTMGNMSIVADRYMYLPSLGFCLLFGMACDVLIRKVEVKKTLLKGVVYFCFILLFATLSIKTYMQSKVWKDTMSLWSHDIKISPDDSFARIARGLAYKDDGSYDMALEDFAFAINRKLRIPLSDINMVRVNGEIVELPPEVVRMNSILLDNPFLYVAYRERAEVHRLQGRYDLAVSDLNNMLKINPRDGDVFFRRSAVYNQKGDKQKAVSDALKAKELGYAVDEKYLNSLLK